VPDGNTDGETSRVCSVQLVIIDQLKDTVAEKAGMGRDGRDDGGQTRQDAT
jgi:hypothetical protein